jgi:ferredoxin-type protein NapH
VNRRQSIRAGLLSVSFFLAPVTFYHLSPVISTVGAFSGVVTGAVLLFGAQFFSAIVLGRAWCGWVCPSGGLQEACFRARDRRVRGGRLNLIKFFLWVPWLGNLVFALVKFGPKRVDPFFMTTSGFSAGSLPGIITYVAVFGLLIVLPALAVGRRAFCHYLCWMAPFMIVGRAVGRMLRVPTLQMKPDKAKCVGCGTCTRVCPMSLEVTPMVARGVIRSSECINCGACADNCPQHAISFAFAPDRQPGNGRQTAEAPGS